MSAAPTPGADQAAAKDLAVMCKDWDQHAEARMAKFAVGNLARAYLAQLQENSHLVKAYAALLAKHTTYVSEKIDAASADATLKAALEASTKDFCDALDKAEAQQQELAELRRAANTLLKCGVRTKQEDGEWTIAQSRSTTDSLMGAWLSLQAALARKETP